MSTPVTCPGNIQVCFLSGERKETQKLPGQGEVTEEDITKKRKKILLTNRWKMKKKQFQNKIWEQKEHKTNTEWINNVEKE